jgi:hypothetical protein
LDLLQRDHSKIGRLGQIALGSDHLNSHLIEEFILFFMGCRAEDAVGIDSNPTDDPTESASTGEELGLGCLEMHGACNANKDQHPGPPRTRYG